MAISSLPASTFSVLCSLTPCLPLALVYMFTVVFTTLFAFTFTVVLNHGSYAVL